MLACLATSTLALNVGMAARPATARVPGVQALGGLFDMLSMGDPTMIEPSKALPGRNNPMMIKDRHFVLGNKMEGVPDGLKVAVFANGCFVRTLASEPQHFLCTCRLICVLFRTILTRASLHLARAVGQ